MKTLSYVTCVLLATGTAASAQTYPGPEGDLNMRLNGSPPTATGYWAKTQSGWVLPAYNTGGVMESGMPPQGDPLVKNSTSTLSTTNTLAPRVRK